MRRLNRYIVYRY